MLQIWRRGLTRCPAARPFSMKRHETLARTVSCTSRARHTHTTSRDASKATSSVAWAQPRSPATSDAQRQTIYALATASGTAGIAVVRVSGPRSRDVRTQMVRPAHRRWDKEPTPWKLERCTIIDPESEEVLDDALAVFFPGTHRYL